MSRQGVVDVPTFTGGFTGDITPPARNYKYGRETPEPHVSVGVFFFWECL